MVDRDSISKINQKVIKQFPEMSGKKPIVSRESLSNGTFRYLLVYRGEAILPGGRTLARIVRVTADDRGRILRMSTSK
jgi:hypothetical protein